MFERFTDRARQVVVLAQEEARTLGHNYIGTEHLLLGLVAEGQGIAYKSLFAVGLELNMVREEVERLVGRGKWDESRAQHIPFTKNSKRVLEDAMKQALRLGHNYIGTEHQLLALLESDESKATEVLGVLEVEHILVRQQVIAELRGAVNRMQPDKVRSVEEIKRDLEAAKLVVEALQAELRAGEAAQQP
jgi:ATP-dependent Clp protease ATP-binding subunit ClpC